MSWRERWNQILVRTKCSLERFEGLVLDCYQESLKRIISGVNTIHTNHCLEVYNFMCNFMGYYKTFFFFCFVDWLLVLSLLSSSVKRSCDGRGSYLKCLFYNMISAVLRGIYMDGSLKPADMPSRSRPT